MAERQLKERREDIGHGPHTLEELLMKVGGDLDGTIEVEVHDYEEYNLVLVYHSMESEDEMMRRIRMEAVQAERQERNRKAAAAKKRILNARLSNEKRTIKILSKEYGEPDA